MSPLAVDRFWYEMSLAARHSHRFGYFVCSTALQPLTFKWGIYLFVLDCTMLYLNILIYTCSQMYFSILNKICGMRVISPGCFDMECLIYASLCDQCESYPFASRRRPWVWAWRWSAEWRSRHLAMRWGAAQPLRSRAAPPGCAAQAPRAANPSCAQWWLRWHHWALKLRRNLEDFQSWKHYP